MFILLMVNKMNIDVRNYIISNFKEDEVKDIRESIEKTIESHDDEPLIGLGVLFELLWNNSDEDTKTLILNNIKRGFN